jgi:hypothetical protein
MPGLVSPRSAFTVASFTSPGPYSVGLRSCIYKEGYETVPATGRTTQFTFLIDGVATASELDVMWGNFSRGGSDAPPSAPIVISATLVTPVSDDLNDYPIGDGSTPPGLSTVRLTFDGLEDITIPQNEFVISDPIPGITVSAGDQPMIRTFVRSTDEDDIQVPCNWSTSHSGEAQSHHFAGDVTEDLEALNVGGAQVFLYTPMMLRAGEVTLA